MKKIDTDEPTQIETLLHNTRAHSPDGWRKLSKSLIELSDDDRLLIEYAPTLRAEVKRLREGIVNALIPTETRPIIHPLVKLGDLRNALKELIE